MKFQPIIARALPVVAALILVSTSVQAAGPGCGGRGQGGMRQGGRDADAGACLADLPKEDLSESEAASLRHMREEEKLARDVYLTLAEAYDVRVFHNIARSEQRHMDAVSELLKRYELPDPVASDDVGAFSDPAFTELYASLVAEGRKSYTAALTVGATIEDLDIKDLQDALAEADNADIALVYGNLARGSRNHMRAFAGRLADAGQTYQAQHIGQDELAAILADGHERGAGRGRGRGQEQGQGQGRGRGARWSD